VYPTKTGTRITPVLNRRVTQRHTGTYSAKLVEGGLVMVGGAVAHPAATPKPHATAFPWGHIVQNRVRRHLRCNLSLVGLKCTRSDHPNCARCFHPKCTGNVHPTYASLVHPIELSRSLAAKLGLCDPGGHTGADLPPLLPRLPSPAARSRRGSQDARVILFYEAWRLGIDFFAILQYNMCSVDR